jgi:hypothetical protein
MENFVKNYSKQLEDSGQHLTYKTIAAYINLYNDLSFKEKNFVENHINSCKNCFNRFADVFDEDFEFDDKTISLKFQQTNVDEQKRIYQSSKGNIEILFSNENSKIGLKFLQLPEELKNQNFRINVSSEVFRIISAQENEFYFLYNNISIEDIQDINVEILKAYDSGEAVTKSSGRKYYFIAAAAAIIAIFIGYFYFNLFENEVTIVKNNKVEVDSSLKAKREPLGNHLITESQTNKENFKTNSVLENFIHRNIRSEEKGINIISPLLNDTVKVPFEFRWESKLERMLKKVVIVNNKNKIVWEKVTTGDSLTFKGKLNSGLYYWKFFNNKNLITVSKFFILNKKTSNPRLK